MDAIWIIILISLIVFVLGGALCGWLAVRELARLRVRLSVLERRTDPLSGRPVARRDAPVAETSSAPEPVETPASSVDMPSPAPRPVAAKAPTSVETGETKPALDLEALLGAKGSVWVGGLALLLGAVFLLRYTIESGLLSPVMRLSLAALMGIVALALSEWLARRDMKTPVGRALSQRADIPALLAAVGIFSLFGTVYTAHALYGLLSTLPAFIGMAGVALGAMALSLRRGPWLAAIGLIGALAVPLLVASVTPSYVGVLAYAALITIAALGVAWRLRWHWLTGSAMAGATFWLVMLQGKAVNGVQFCLWSFGLLAVTAATLWSLSRYWQGRSRDGLSKEGRWSSLWRYAGWLGIAILSYVGMLAGDDWEPVSQLLPFGVLAGLIASSVLRRHCWPALLIGSALFAFVFLPVIMPGQPAAVWAWLGGIVAVTALMALAGLRVADQFEPDRQSTAYVLGAGILALLALIAGLDELSGALPAVEDWGGFCMAGLFAVAAWLQTRTAIVRGSLWMVVLAWTAALLSISDRLVVSGLISVGLLLSVLLAARRDDLWTRLAPLSLAALAGWSGIEAVSNSVRLFSMTPFANELWLFFGLPGGVAALGAVLMARRQDDLAAQALRGGAVVFTLLLVVLLIHHAMNGGNLRADVGFEELAVQLFVAFAALFGASGMRAEALEWPGRAASPGRYIVPLIALGLSGFSLFLLVLGQMLVFNPLLNADTTITGHPVFNMLVLAYLAPALLLGLSALRYAGHRPVWFVRTLGALSGLSWLLWTTTGIRRLAQGEVIALHSVPWDNVELYAVSAVWLMTGIALLVAGSVSGRRDLRLASAVLITVTVLKVFLLDMSELEGAIRALSFIGLGIVLIGIGRFYQRLLGGTHVS